MSLGDGSVLPIVEAKRAEMVKSDHAMNDLVRLIPTPGHTIDHFSVQVGKAGQDAVITGDMVTRRCRRATRSSACLPIMIPRNRAGPGGTCSAGSATAPH